jgi:hypothetical protein
MKKSVVIAALGLAVTAVSSFGQGQMTFNSYLAGVSSSGIQTLFSAGLGGAPVGAGFSADLLYSLTPFSDTAGSGALLGGLTASGAGSPSFFNVVTPFGTSGNTLGYFQGANNFELNPYTANSTVYFEVIAYQTALGYANSTERGHSAEFSATLATGVNSPTTIAFTPFTVNAVGPIPEPTTLALAGLGGLASLVMMRRKKA